MAAYRRRRSSYRSSSYSRRNHGAERAAQHIAEAHALSERLGGMDGEVKRFFFELSPARLADVMERYGRRFGADKRAYAEETFPRWRSGERKMSGLVAGRLFDLLPPIMPIDLKLRIVEGLFEKAGPVRTDHVLAPADANPAEIVRFVDGTCFDYLADAGIDPSIKRQFDWLSGEDARVAEQLFRHATQIGFDTKKAAFAAVMAQMDRERETHGDAIRQVVSTIRLRRHEVRIKRSPSVEGMRSVDRITFDAIDRPVQTDRDGDGGSWGWLIWLLAGAVVLFFLSQ